MGSTPKRLSASRISSLFGLNKYKSEYELWLDLMYENHGEWLSNIMDYKPKDISSEPAIVIGNQMEDPIMDYLFRYRIRDRELFFEKGVLSCHIDGRLDDSLNIETKTSNTMMRYSEWGDAGTDQIPEYYYIQTQAQMHLTGAERTTVPLLFFPQRQSHVLANRISAMNFREKLSLVGSMEDIGLLETFSVKYNQEIGKKIEDTANEWWIKHIDGKCPPSISTNKKVLSPTFGDVKPTKDILAAIDLYKKQKINSDIESGKCDSTRTAILNYMIKNATVGRSDKVRIRDGNKIVATYNSATGYFSIRKDKKENGINKKHNKK